MPTPDTRTALVERLEQYVADPGRHILSVDTVRRVILALSAPEERGEGEIKDAYIDGWDDGYHSGVMGSDTPITSAERGWAHSETRRHLASTTAPAQEPDAWLAEVYFKGAWGAPALYRHQGDAEEHNHLRYEGIHPARVVPLYRAPPVAQEPKPTLDDALRDLHDRLRDEGRDADADLIDRAGWAMEAADAERAQGAEEPECKHGVRRGCDCGLCDLGNGFETVPQGLPREESRDPLYYSAGLQMAGSYLASGRIDDMRAVLETMVESVRPVAGSEERVDIQPSLVNRAAEAVRLAHLCDEPEWEIEAARTVLAMGVEATVAALRGQEVRDG